MRGDTRLSVRRLLDGRVGHHVLACGTTVGGPLNCSSEGSTQAQLGALATQMFVVGLTADGSSSVPTRTTVSPGRPLESENNWVPQLEQNRRVTVFPLSAGFTCLPGEPETSMASLGKMTLTVPLEEILWQSLHQQILDGPASAVISYRISPQRQPPANVFM